VRPRSLGRLISIPSPLRAGLSVPVSTKRKTHPIHDPPAGNLPDRSYGSRRHPPNLWALPLRAGSVDFYVGPDAGGKPIPKLSREVLFENRRTVLCRAGHPLASATSL